MDYVSKATSVIRAIDAVTRTLPKYLPAVLEEYETAEPGLHLPDPDRYHQALSVDGIEQTVTNAQCAIWVFQSSPSRLVKEVSNTPIEGIWVQSTFIEVRIAYNTNSTVGYQPTGYPHALDPKDVLARRGYYYVGGIIDVVLKHLCCESNGSVSDVLSITDDFAGSVFQTGTGQQWGGIGQVVFELEQHVSVPYCPD